MAITVELNGVDRTSLVRPGTLRIPDRIGERSEASFDLVVAAGGYHPAPLDTVKVYEGVNLIFSGFLWDPEEEKVTLRTGDAVYISCRAVDNHLLADRRLAAESYDNQTAGAIVGDLRTKYLAGDGVQAGTIQTGPTLTRAVFNYVSMSKALDELAEIAGFYWYISHDKQLHFVDRATNAAPWAVTNTAAIRNVRVRRHRELYRNKQYLRAGMDMTDSRTERFKGDGEAKTFTLSFPVAKAPGSVTVNGALRTVGIRGIDRNRDWYWQKGDAVISQDDAAAALAATDTLAVTYQGMFPIIVEAEAGNEIIVRKAVEGGTGIYEHVDEITSLDDDDAARQVADAKLARYAKLDGSITFETEQSGLKAGQLISVNLTAHNLAEATYLIEEVSFEDVGLDRAGIYRYQVKAVAGDAVGGWIQFFKRMVGKTFSIRENEILVKLKRLTDGVKVGDTLSISKAAPESRVGYATVGFAEVG